MSALLSLVFYLKLTRPRSIGTHNHSVLLPLELLLDLKPLHSRRFLNLFPCLRSPTLRLDLTMDLATRHPTILDLVVQLVSIIKDLLRITVSVVQDKEDKVEGEDM